ncbi:hypothetical protein ACFWTE_28720 [Nocardiopsis sp. NPDC058631]|uniref:hypothetical protein n=1 Tax=Nocardiopsis sp. NPDC058631 TaxID=3346566 RepID=UPI00366170FB
MLIKERRFRVKVSYGTFEIAGINSYEHVSGDINLICPGPAYGLPMGSLGNDFAPTVLMQLWDGNPATVDDHPDHAVYRVEVTEQVHLMGLMVGLSLDGPFPVPHGTWAAHLWRDGRRAHLSWEGALLPGEDDDGEYTCTGDDFPGEAVESWVVQFCPW